MLTTAVPEYHQPYRNISIALGIALGSALSNALSSALGMAPAPLACAGYSCMG